MLLWEWEHPSLFHGQTIALMFRNACSSKNYKFSKKSFTEPTRIARNCPHIATASFLIIILHQPLWWIGHFRVTLGLFFKTSPGAIPFIWILVVIHMQMKANFHTKRWAPALALKKRPMVIQKWPIYLKLVNSKAGLL